MNDFINDQFGPEEVLQSSCGRTKKSAMAVASGNRLSVGSKKKASA